MAAQARAAAAAAARAEVTLAPAEAALIQTDSSGAADLFKRALKSDDLTTTSQRIRAYRGLVTAHLLRDDQRRAVRDLSAAARLDGALRSEEWREIANLMVAAGSPKAATAFLKSLIEPAPEAKPLAPSEDLESEGTDEPHAIGEEAVPGDPDAVMEDAETPLLDPPEEASADETQTTVADQTNPVIPDLTPARPVEGQTYPAPDPVAVAIQLLAIVREFEGGAAILKLLKTDLAHLRDSMKLRQAALSQAAALKDVSIFRAVNAYVAPVTMTHGIALEFATACSVQGQYRDALGALAAVVDKPARLAPGFTAQQVRQHNSAISKLKALHLEMLLALGRHGEARPRLTVLAGTTGLGAVADFVRAFFAFMDGHVEKAASFMSKGFSSHLKLLTDSVPLFDLSEGFEKWFDVAQGRGEHEIFWRREFASARDNLDAYATMLFRFACLFIALRRPAVAYGVLGMVIRWSGSCRLEAAKLRRRLSISHLEHENGVVLASEAELDTATKEDLTVDAILAGTLGNEDLMMDRLDRLREDFAGKVPASNQEWATLTSIARAITALQQGQDREATAILRASGAEQRLAELDRRPDLTTIYLSGYGWSGSSALYDSLKSMPFVVEMLGAGDSAHLNHGADTEPMLFEGPWGLGALWTAIYSNERSGSEVLWNFFRVHVLATLYQNYFEHKSTQAAQHNRSVIGPVYTDAMAAFMLDLIKAMRGDRRKFSVSTLRPFRNLTGRLAKAVAAPTKGRFILVNNGIRAFAVEASVLTSKSVFISVLRDVRDQFVDQRRSNRFFRASIDTFIKQQRRRRISFLRGKNLLLQTGLASEVFDISFEDWVNDASLRARMIRHLVGRYDAALDAKHFKPALSARNIGIHRGAMSVQEEQAVAVALKKSRSDMKAVEGDPFAGRGLAAR